MRRSVKSSPLSWPWKIVIGAFLGFTILAPLAISVALFCFGWQKADPQVTPLFYIAAICAFALFCGALDSMQKGAERRD